MADGLQVNIRRGDGTGYRFDLGDIQTITKTYTATLRPQPVIIYGYTGSFMLDMGVSATFSISYERSSPSNYNNSSSDSKLWTNAQWKTRFKQSMNTWQSLHGGYIMQIVSPDQDLYPSGTFNGYIKTAPFNHSVGDISKISGRIDFTLGKLQVG